MRVDDAWILKNGSEMTQSTAKFLLLVLERGEMKFPLSEEAVRILKVRAGVLPETALPKPPPPPFIANTPKIDKQSRAAGEREEF